MDKTLCVLGQLAGLMGALLSLGGGLGRLLGHYRMGDFEAMTLLLGGMAGLLLGCFLLLLFLVRSRP